MRNQSALLRLGEPFKLLFAAFADLFSLKRELCKDTANSCMGILTVVNGVLRALLHGKVKVKVHDRARLLHIEHEPDRVNRNFLKQVNKRYGVARPLGHSDNVSVAHKADKLHKKHVEPVFVNTDRPHGAFHSCNMAVVIRTPDVNGLIKAALFKLVSVVGDIGGKISRVAVLADKNVVLKLKLVNIFLTLALLFKHCGLNLNVFIPERAVLFIGIAAVFEKLNGVLQLAAVVERQLAEPGVVIYTVFFHCLFHVFNVLRQGKVNKRFSALLLALLEIAVAVNGGKLLGALSDVRAVIAVLGKLHAVFAFKKLLISDIERKGEFVNLVAGVVNIKLAADLVARILKHGRKAVAQSAAPCVAHMHRAGGVCGNELNVQPFSLAVIAFSVGVACFSDVKQNVCVICVIQKEVDKAGAGNLNFFKVSVLV